MTTHEDHGQHGRQDETHGGGSTAPMYLRFGGMILTGMVVMYVVMYVGTYALDHVRYSESRVYMAMTMGGAMGLVMFAWMMSMYRSARANLAVVAASAVLLGTGVYLDRSQELVQGEGWLSSMIPHHSLAITRSERAEIDDVRVCRLAVSISEAQRREILEMDWLLADIRDNGPARTAADAERRAVPEFPVAAERTCPGTP